MTEYVLARGLYRGGAFILALVVLVVLGLQIKWVLVQFFAAAIVAAGMAPLVSRLTDPERTRGWRWRPPAAMVVLLVYLVLAVVALVLGSILVGTAMAQGTTLVARVPEFAARLQDWYASVLERSTLLKELDPWSVFGGSSALGQWVTGALRQVLGAAGLLVSLLGGALNVVFVLFMALYMTVSGPAIRDYMVVFLPRVRQGQVRRIITNISVRLGRWVLGEMELCLIVGVGAAIGFGLIGVPGAALLGLIWAVAELIPGIGPFISAVPSILLGFLAGPETGILATIFTVAWSQVENNILVPRVMSRAVKLNPLVVLGALLIGNELLGLAGALFAIPAAAAVAVVTDELHSARVRDLESDPVPAELAAEVPLQALVQS